jgi:2,4-dienoyl-CoA reductase-like NADH-dependent reductase (Old Yellow Enzyme family)/NADPH-dependent 2,4-dienoyl-CoA reductase/sulfur reductase-like enzyme
MAIPRYARERGHAEQRASQHARAGAKCLDAALKTARRTSMAARFPHLAAPGRIGSMELRNRMVVTAMGVWLGDGDGVVGERQIAYHVEQAKGGAALIVTGATGVSYPFGGLHENQIAISDDRHIPGLSALATAVHAHGAKIAFQLHRAASQALLDLYAGRPLWLPSLPLPEPIARMPFVAEELAIVGARQIPPPKFHEMTLEDIQLVVRQFVEGARRAREAGADGVEVHVAHGYILGSFLSAAANRRTDTYGGSLENRARIGLEIVRQIRATVGTDYPVWVKLDSREVERPGGITPEDAIAAARLFEQAGVDAVTVSAYHGAARGALHSASHTPHEPAANLPYAARVKAAIAIPVIASGRIEPKVAEAAIAEGRIDFLSMGRKILADPHLPRKLVEGRAEEVRPCIYCYTCISSIYLDTHVRCAVRPETGFEHLPPPAVAASPKKVVVIGGGPSGMEAARRLDALGCKVTLLEKGPRLGGTLRLAALAYEPNERLLDWLVRRLEASRVDVRLDVEATPELVRSLAPDHVVVATGAVRTTPDIPGALHPQVLSGEELRSLMLGEITEGLKAKTGVLTRLAARVGAATGATANLDLVRKATRQWMPLGDTIVIIGGELVGLELAEFLAERGRKVTVVDEPAQFGAGLSIVRRMRLLDELAERGVVLRPGVSNLRIGADSVSFLDGAGASHCAPADHVIVAKGARGDERLAEVLRAEGFDVRVAGDCTGVGYIEGAMRDAARVAADLCGAEAAAVAPAE